MCQLCTIETLATEIRWPEPLERLVKGLDFLLDTAHDDYEANKAACRKDTVPESVLDVLRLINTAIEELDTAREKWWFAPEKALRRRLEADCDSKRYVSKFSRVLERVVNGC
jgi:hypothetical protein